MPEQNPIDEFDSLSAGPVPGIDIDERQRPADGSPSAESDSAQADKINQLGAQVEEQRQLYLRALADLDNYKRRMDRMIVERSNEGRREFIKRMLPVLDNLQRAAQYRQQGVDADKLVDGVLATVRQFLSLLEAENVRPIDVMGKEFDPALSEAVSARHEPNVPENTVLDEARKGYMLGDDVLRPAQVVVSTNSE